MAKIKAVLDQETWVEVDIPEEFQAIINALFCTDSLYTDSIDASEVSMVAGNDVPNEAATGLLVTQQETQPGGVMAVISSENSDQGISSSLTSNSEKNKADINSSSQVNNSTVKERGKSSSQSLFYGGVGYHMVNWSVTFLGFSNCFLNFLLQHFFQVHFVCLYLQHLCHVIWIHNWY